MGTHSQYNFANKKDTKKMTALNIAILCLCLFIHKSLGKTGLMTSNDDELGKYYESAPHRHCFSLNIFVSFQQLLLPEDGVLLKLLKF